MLRCIIVIDRPTQAPRTQEGEGGQGRAQRATNLHVCGLRHGAGHQARERVEGLGAAAERAVGHHPRGAELCLQPVHAEGAQGGACGGEVLGGVEGGELRLGAVLEGDRVYWFRL